MIYTICRIPTVKDSPSPFTTYTKPFADMKAEDDHTLLIKTDLARAAAAPGSLA